MIYTTLLIFFLCDSAPFTRDINEAIFLQQTAQDTLPPDSDSTSPNLLRDNAPDVNIEISGLIIDDTRSKAGRDFYDLFFTTWQAPSGFHAYTITIKETPGFGRNTSVTVEINDVMVARRMLQPRADLIEEQVNISIQLLNAHISSEGNLQRQLQSEDQEGTGIF